MKWIKADRQDIKNSIESWQNCLNENEDRIPYLKVRISESKHESKNLLKITISGNNNSTVPRK